MKKGSTLFLRIAVILIGVPIFLVCIFLIPKIGNYAASLYPDMTYIKYLISANLYATAIPFYFALYQAFELLNYIDKNKAFSELSVKALKNIKYCAVAISVLYAMNIPFFYLMAEIDDAPGIIILGLVISFASMVIAVFSAVLQKLLNEAVEMKSINDLTI